MYNVFSCCVVSGVGREIQIDQLCAVFTILMLLVLDVRG